VVVGWGRNVKWCVVVGAGVVVGFGVVVVGRVVVVVSLGARLIGAPPVLPCGWTTGFCCGGGLAAGVAETVATVARTVASTTPDPARMTSDRRLEVSSPGGTISSGPSMGSVTALSPGVTLGVASEVPVCLTRC
jgi:hypothetical protein